ncbi:MAG: Acetyl-/propionyl-coenzyme A carboxylase alpha chain [Planctomycetes bacterium]|nr:Acetyl-/propionyl-coenzyme A carboxylase alpha chain [Planctomycetota bacterium]
MTAPACRPFRRVLVANRGEIAVRLIRACRELGLETVAVASESDRDAPHALAADRTVILGAGPAAESYLHADRVLAAAKESGADAIHPGYGFFSERADFARRVVAAGLVWIGPPPDAIDAIGDKIRAKEVARRVGVPTCPSWEGDANDAAEAARAASRIGYPVLVKAAAGGGGRGMRVVAEPSKLAEALEGASREAAAAFGSGRVFLERYLEPARHVEIQILADSFGNVFSLGERECSVQRRHQKILEEAPSVAVTPELRLRMGEAAVALASEIGYVGAGTVEFLLAPSGEFSFLEVNTRLQVEHPVTEMVQGIDLAQGQIRAAAGECLEEYARVWNPRGHAIELRICAEDPSMQFAPQAGRILHLELPQGPGIRVDSGVRAGFEVPPHYDSLLMKLIVHAPDRRRAIDRALLALRDLVILGPVTNVAYLRAILSHEDFRRGDVSTSFLARKFASWTDDAEIPDEALVAAAAADALAPQNGSSAAGPAAAAPTPWQTLGPWRASGGGGA